MANSDYETGDTKIGPDRRAVAIRSAFPDMEVFANTQWAIMSVDTGGYYAPYVQVEAWADLVEVPADPEVPEEPEPTE